MEYYISRQAAVEKAMEYCPDDDGICSKAGTDLRELLDDLENLPSTDVKPVRWIPVTERLPEQSGEYLVILCTIPEVPRLYDYHAPNKEFGQVRGGVWCVEAVTHWMPLPEPPNCGADMREED